MTTITKGMRSALGKLPGSGYKCPECGLVVPRYTGRYPRACPDCGIKLGITNERGERIMSRAEQILSQVDEKKVNWEDLADVSYADALKMISDHRNYEDATNTYKDLEFGSGGFEDWFAMRGGKITLSDVKKMKPFDASSLLMNIFYNGRDLKSAISEKVIKAAIDFVAKKGDTADFGNSLEDYSGPWKNMVKYAIDQLGIND